MSAHVGDMDDLATLAAFDDRRDAPGDADRRRRRAARRRPAPGVPLAPVGPRPRRRAVRSRRCSTTTPTSPRRWPSTACSTATAGSSGSPSTAPATATTAPSGAGSSWSPTTRATTRAAHLALRRPARRRRRRAQPVPDGAVAPAQPPASRGTPALPSVRACSDDELALLDRQLDDRAALRADVEHGPALRRGRLARRHLPPGRVRRAGRDGAGGASPGGATAPRGYRFGVDGERSTPATGRRPRSPPTSLAGAPSRASSPPASSRAWSTWSSRSCDAAARRDRPGHGDAERRRLPQRLPHRGLRRAP